MKRTIPIAAADARRVAAGLVGRASLAGRRPACRRGRRRPSPAPSEPALQRLQQQRPCATPVKVEIYEPTIPIPADPAGRVRLRLHQGRGRHRSTKGRASFLWPGDARRRGPQDLLRAARPADVSSVENGYPVQVNSSTRPAPPKETNEPFPGTSMTTDARATARPAPRSASPRLRRR